MSKLCGGGWDSELLIICSMCYRCCISEWCSITISWHWGPWGGRLRPRSVYNLPVLERKGGKKWPLPAESHSSSQSQFFRCSLFPVPCSSTQTSSGHDEKWCDAIFYSALDTLMEGNVVHWFQTPKRSKMRNTIFGSSPGTTFKPRKTKLLIVSPSAAK